MPRLSARRAMWLPLVAAIAGGGLVATAPTASANSAVSVSPSSVAVGGTVTLSGSDCFNEEAPWNSPFIVMGGVGTVLQTRAADDGTWSLTFTLARSVGPGSYPLHARCTIGSTDISYPPVTLTVVGPPPPSSPPPVLRPPDGSVARSTGPAGAPGAPGAAGSAVAPSSSSPEAAPSPATTAAAATSAAATASAISPTPAADCSDCALLVGTDPLRPGQELTLRYTGFAPEEQVTVVMRSTPVTLGTFPADASGMVTAAVALPDSVEPGRHTLTLSGPVTGDRVVEFRLASGPASGKSVAAETEGAGLAWPLGIGAAMTVVLAAIGFHLYRRRTARVPALAG